MFMQKRGVRPLDARSRNAKSGRWLLIACGALLCAACGETSRASEPGPLANSGSGGSDSTVTTAGSGVSTGGASHSNATASATATATATTAAVEPAAGGAAPTSMSSDGSAGAGALGPGGAGSDDECEVVPLNSDADLCQVEIRCIEYVQHTNCRSQGSESWQCDTDEHDNSKPHTLDGNPGWFNHVTGAADAMQACEAVVDVNLERGSVTPVASDDCSELTIETQWELSRALLCGNRYQVSSGATVWDAQPAIATCSDGSGGADQTCRCIRTGPDDGEYRVEAPDLESALADVWAFCTNASPAALVEQGACDPIANSTSAAGCEIIDNCALLLTDASGIELEQLSYREIRCEPEAGSGMLSCSCRIDDDEFSFRTTAGQQPGLSACEDLAEVCNAGHPVARAEGPAECELSSEFSGRNQFGVRYSCEVPVSLGGRNGVAHARGALECTEPSDGLLVCVCHDYFASTSTPLEPAALDFTAAVIECEALLEAESAAAP